MNVEGLRCVVTGTASGIGDAVARSLVERGAHVVSLDVKDPSADVAEHHTVDLGDRSTIDTFVDRLQGSYDVLANVAGIPGTFPGEQVLRVNFLGLRHLTEAMLPKLNSGGSIVNVSSVAGSGWPVRLAGLTELMQTTSFEEGLAWFEAHPQEGNTYNFSKEAVTVYTMWRCIELRRQGLRINAVLPSATETPILVDFEASMGKEIIDDLKTLIGRHATPADIAPAVVFLASPESGWLNGSSITTDGGVMAAVAVGTHTTPHPPARG